MQYSKVKFVKELKKNHLKLTGQRLAIYKYLTKTREHPRADVIYQSVLKKYPHISFATVYKNLGALSRSGMINEINVGEDNFRYDADTSEHSHLICEKCHDISDYFDLNSGDIKANIQAFTGFEIKSQRMFFYGTCPRCKSGEQNAGA